jgi:glycosyltransferase involved in cell wall biosynthesis
MLGPFKLNHRLLAAWLNSALAEDPDCHLVFVGQNDPGPYGRELVNTITASRAPDRIHITGWVSGSDFSGWLSTADVAVQLRTRSRGESSAAVLDCMNHGLPVIVNAHGASEELPADAVWRLEDTFEEADLIQALETLYREPGTRQRLGTAARAVITRHHTPEVCARKYARAIENAYYCRRYAPDFLVHRLAELEGLPREPDRLVCLASDLAANQPSPVPQRRLFIDVSATSRQDLKAGIDRVSRSIVLGLIQHPPAGWRAEPVFLDSADGVWHFRYARSYTLSLLGCPGSWTADDPVDMHPGDLLLCPDLTGDILVKAEKTGLYHHLRQTGVGLVFTLFDLLPVLRPDVFPAGADERFHEWLVRVCGVADQVVCISRSVAEELQDWYEADPAFACLPLPDIQWFHLGADLDASAPTTGLPPDAAARLELINTRTCFLMVGTLEPRKGHLQAIAAFDRLWKKGVDVTLVIVGKQGWTHLPPEQCPAILQIVSTLKEHPERDRRLFWLEGISDQYLEAVYSAADALIAASEAEGFGIPLIEAAQHGLPVLARDIPVFREVARDHAFYFHGTDPESLSDAVLHWLDLYRENRHPRSDAMPWLTWRQSCEKLMEIMARLMPAVS